MSKLTLHRSKPNLLIVDYQHSYFFQRQRKQQRKRLVVRILLLLVMLLLSLLFAAPQLLAQTSVETKPIASQVYAPTLLFNHPNSQFRSALALDNQASVNVNGLVALVEVKQVFINPHELELSGEYQFPLPENAAVNYLKVAIGERIIEGKIMEKQHAKEVFIKAKREGKKASLVEQHRPNLFSNKIANIPAGQKVEVTLRYVQTLDFSEQKFQLQVPFAITPRYQVKQGESEASTDELITQQHLLAGVKAGQVKVKVAVDAGVPIAEISSPSHLIHAELLNNEQTKFVVTLANDEQRADRAFLLEWQPNKSSHPQLAAFEQQVGDEYFGMMMVMPPLAANTPAIARDVTFVIDQSGSMQGSSMIQAKSSLLFALNTLGANDSFNIIAFDSNYYRLFNRTEMVNDKTIARAQRFIREISADGGTEMYQPLSSALQMPLSPEQQPNVLRQIIFITDGAVNNEAQLFELLSNRQRQQKLFTVGIGAAPNGYFMRKAAQFGGGTFTLINNHHQVEQQMTTLLEKVSHPIASQLALHINQGLVDHVELYPKTLPDLYHQEPVIFAYRSPLPLSSVELTGVSDQRAWHQEVIVPTAKHDSAISTLWARFKVDDLLDGLLLGGDKEWIKQQVLSTALNHQIMSPYTSFVAVEQELPQNQRDKLLLADNRLTAKTQQMLAMPKTALSWQMYSLVAGLFFIFTCVALVAMLRTQQHALAKHCG